MTASILFATPMYGGSCTEPFFRSSMRTVAALEMAGIPYDWTSIKNESLVHRGRMEMVAAFLRDPTHSHLFWIDADMEWDPEGVAALWNLETDIAVGLYAMKRPDLPLSAWKDGRLVRIEDCPKHPFPVEFAGTGFMLIKREAIEKIVAHLQWKSEAAEKIAAIATASGAMHGDWRDVLREMVDGMAAEWQGAQGPVPTLFHTPIHDGGLESEDFHFCRIARETGYQIVADPSVKLGHYGMTRYG